jgi:hypothetical protein
MLKVEEIEYMERDIKKVISSISHEHYQFLMQNFDSHDEDYPGWTKIWLERRIVDLYYKIAAYLEAKGMPLLLYSFQELCKEQIMSKTKLLETELEHPEGYDELELLVKFKLFLGSFKAFDYTESQVDDFNKLTSILKNTSFIVKNSKCIIKNEADIYKQVKWVLSLYYPSCKNKNKASFIKQFKTYNPDILLPELKTAIEYKYIRDKTANIDDFIDQLIIDAKAYTGDHYYEKFIAVFYISDAGIATPESIELAWKHKELPDNWTLILTGDSVSIKQIN